jgi:hypothetical protein
VKAWHELPTNDKRRDKPERNLLGIEVGRQRPHQPYATIMIPLEKAA